MSVILPEALALSVVQNSNFGIIILNKDLLCVYSNASVEKITGYEMDFLLQKNPLDSLVIDNQESQNILKRFQSADKKSTVDMDIKIQKKDGNPVAVFLTGYYINIEHDEYLILMIQDITDRKAMDKMMESNIDNFIQTTINLDQAMKKIRDQKEILDLYKTNINKELWVAQSVQKNIIPQEFIENDRFRIWGTCIPSAELGGDYFDYFLFDGSKLGVVIADVCGHGVPSALITTMIKICFERYATDYVEIEKVFSFVNKEITKILQGTGFYFTSFYSIIDLDNMLIESAAAGHDFALCYSPEKGVIELGKSDKGSIIGMFPDAEYGSSFHQLTGGSKIVYFTDGITEARNDSGDFYGLEKLKSFIVENHSIPAKEFGEALIGVIEKFYDGNKANDDKTLVVVDIVNVPDPAVLTETEVHNLVDNAYINGRKYIKNKELRSALREFQKIINYDNRNYGAYSYIGQIYGMTGDLDQAEELLLKALEISREYREGYYFLGIIQYKKGKYQEALKNWKHLMEIAGDFKNVSKYIENINKMHLCD